MASLFARDPIPPPRGHRLALDSVSFIVPDGPTSLGLARYETLVNAEEQETTTIGDAPLEDVPDETEVTTLGEQEDEPDRPVETDIVTFEEQDTRSLLRPVPRRASPHDDLSFAESQHVLFDEAEDPRSLLRPVPPNETRDEDSVEDFNLRDTAGVPSPSTRAPPRPSSVYSFAACAASKKSSRRPFSC